MNPRSLKVRQDHSKSHCGPKVTSSRWTAPLQASDYEETDSCLRSLALVKAQQRDYAEAIALLSQLIDRHPQNAVDYNNRGLVYFQSGQLNQALTDYDRAIQINPQLSSAYNNRANCYAACGQLEQALADYDWAIDLHPSYVRAWINRGITLRDLEQYDQAIENFDIASVLGQLEGHIYAERGRTYHLWGDWNCAIADYQRALSQLPQRSADRQRSGASRVGGECSAVLGSPQVEQLPSAVSEAPAKRRRQPLGEAKRYPKGSPDLRSHPRAEVPSVVATPVKVSVGSGVELACCAKKVQAQKSVFRSDPAYRLRLQVETWLGQLLSPFAV